MPDDLKRRLAEAEAVALARVDIDPRFSEPEEVLEALDGVAVHAPRTSWVHDLRQWLETYMMENQK